MQVNQLQILPKRTLLGILAILTGMVQFVVAQSVLDTIGVTALRAQTTNLDGTAIRVAQVEAEMATNPPTFEVPPGAVGHSASSFTFISSLGTATTYPNSVGAGSTHAQAVAGYFYSLYGGIATNVTHIDNYDAGEFVHTLQTPVGFSAVLPSTNINDAVVNQSFVFLTLSVSEQQIMDSAYDNYAAAYNTLFVSGIGNGGAVLAPSTCYNGIGVAAYGSGSASSVGPTSDNGRSKPDITAPEGYTSFSTPQVSGAAAVLVQAGLRGDGGPATASAADMRTIKALLLNGAVKPQDWTNQAPSPLDRRYGAGILNVFNSYEQLSGQEYSYIIATQVPSGSAHPPTTDPGIISAPHGWDFNTISSAQAFLVNPAMDGINHYYFAVTNPFQGSPLTATITLVWNRQQNQTAINNLALFLIDRSSGKQVAASTSLVDNVQHIFVSGLPAGAYDLQVLKSASSSVSDAETYALAFDFSSTSLAMDRSSAGVTVRWPAYPAGLSIDSTITLVPSISWTRNQAVPVISNSFNYVTFNLTNSAQYFRLTRP